MVFMVVLIVLLPQLSGLTTVKYQPDRSRRTLHGQQEQEQDQEQGYIPPDELQRRAEQVQQQNSKLSMGSLKKKLDYTREDVPFKLHLTSENTSNTTLRRRGNKPNVQAQNDPNAFDYDIDELIQEDQQDREQEFRSRAAKSQQELEDLA